MEGLLYFFHIETLSFVLYVIGNKKIIFSKKNIKGVSLTHLVQVKNKKVLNLQNN